MLNIFLYILVSCTVKTNLLFASGLICHKTNYFATSRNYNNKLRTGIFYSNLHDPQNDFSSTSTIDNNHGQVLSFKEPLSGVTVKIIGSMHYNPYSIELAENVIENAARSNRLGAVVIESCNTRWKNMTPTSTLSSSSSSSSSSSLPLLTSEIILNSAKSIKTQFQSNMKKLLKNEMKASFDMANKYQIPTILGDQNIEETGKRAKNIVATTLSDLIRPYNGGWVNIYKNLKNDFQKSYPTAVTGITTENLTLSSSNSVTLPSVTNQYIGLKDMFDLKLISGAPIAITKYILALIFKVPSIGILLLLLIYFTVTDTNIVNADDILSTKPIFDIYGFTNIFTGYDDIYSTKDLMENFTDYFLSTCFTVLETVFLGRIFLSSLLVDRNQVLARNIRDTCFYIKSNNNNNTLINTNPNIDSSNNNNNKEVIVVLGMAHCNGVRYLLENPYENDDSNNNHPLYSQQDAYDIKQIIQNITVQRTN